MGITAHLHHPAAFVGAGARRGERAVRVAAAAGVAASAVLMGLHEAGFRGWEAWTAGHVTAMLTAGPAFAYRGVFYVDVGRPDIFGLRVTPECTAAIVVIGLLGITALLALLTRLPLRRLALAAALSAAAFFALNLARLVLIAMATRQWGRDGGFYWSHIWAGSFVTIAGVAGVLALYLVTIGTIGHRRSGSGDER